MSKKIKILWLLAAVVWTVMVMAPVWWTLGKVEGHLAHTVAQQGPTEELASQVLGIHLFILFAGFAGLLGAYMVHKRRLGEKTKALEALVASEERFRGIFENASVGIAQISPDSKLIRFNRPFEELIGRSRQELETGALGDFMVGGHREEYRDLMLKALRGEKDAFSLEACFITSRDTQVWGHLNQALIRKPNGEPDYFVLVAKNITDRKLAEQKLFESEERFRVAFETSPDSVNINRLRDGMYISINQGFTNTLGYTKDDVVGKTSHELSIWGDPSVREKLAEELLKHGKVSGLEAKFRAKDGTLVDGLMSAAITQLNGEPHIVSITSDIRSLKSAHEKLAIQQKRIEAIMLASPDPVVVFDNDHHCVYLNPAFTRFFGWTLDEVYGRELPYIPAAHKGPAELGMEQIVTTGRMKPLETQRMTKDGRLLDVLISAASIKDQNDRMTGLVANLHDISPLKEAEASRRMLATAMEQAAEAVVITDLGGDILYVNPAFEKVTGYSKQEVLGQNPRILKSDHQDQKFYQDLWGTITSGEVWSGHLVNRKKNQELFHEEATISPVRDPNGAITNYVAVKRDVSKEMHLEQRLRRSEKMEAIGTLAGGIAHDFNNILGAITGYTELALDELGQEEQAPRDLRQVLKAAERASALIRQILTFSRDVEPDLKPIDLNKAVSQALAMLERTLPKMIEIRFTRGDSLPYVRADFSQLEQVVLNLGTNARDAMQGNGVLLIQTSDEYLDADNCCPEEGMVPGRYVKLSVRDTGCGMDEETLARIFEPFFTTKEPGKGTGLGLSMVFGIVKAHGGHLGCFSQPGHGTTFEIFLPSLEKDGPGGAGRGTSSGELPTGNETILLVDDEKPLRDMSARILTERGYAVRLAENAEQGLGVFNKAPAAIDLVILDLSMPGMGGQECLERLLELDPEIKVIISSGYAMNGSVSRALETGAAGFVPKPYNKSELLQKVRQVLDE